MRFEILRSIMKQASMFSAIFTGIPGKGLGILGFSLLRCVMC